MREFTAKAKPTTPAAAVKSPSLARSRRAADRDRDPIQPHSRGQTRLTIHEPGDRYEEEADRMAGQVASSRQPILQGPCPCGGGCPACKAQEADRQQPILQTSRVERSGPGNGIAPAVVHDVLRSGGEPLDPPTRAFMEPRFGHDFSGVRVHADDRAARSAKEIAANAYTVGGDIVFAAGRFDPRSDAGRRLLAHELTHVVQQRGEGALSLQRDKDKDEAKEGGSKKTAPAKADPATAYFHVVVRDKDLDLGGGVLVSDLADAKAKLLKRKVDAPWTLVLAIHASENRLGAQSGPDWQKNAIFYDAEAIKALFGGDSAFVKWRDDFGPSRVVLYGCQVTAAFEQTIADNLTRGGKGLSAGGLGEGCKPLSTTVTFGANTRREYDKLADTEKEKMLAEVQAANSTWGYYGGPPVPNDEVLDYLFKGPKPGSWPQVEVIFKQGDDFVSGKPPVPYWNRLSNSTYLRQCTKAVGNLREHKPTAPKEKQSE